MNKYSMRFFTLLTLLCLCGGTTFAQQKLKFRVAEFGQDPFSTLARGANQKLDSDGKLYAIIKVTSDIPSDNLDKFNFDFGFVNSFKEKPEDLDELWIYVQRGAKRVTISREGYTTVSKYDLGLTIEAGSTYEMKLSVQAPVVQYRILQFKVNPANEQALVKVRREGSTSGFDLWGSVNESGSINRLMELGTYYYEVVAANYETSEGVVELTSGDGNYVESVTLKPNFGWLEIDDSTGIAGAEIYVDNKKIGTVPYKSETTRWEARDGYQLMITNGELYKTYNSTFSIKKGEVTKLSPQLESDFAQTTIRVDKDEKADIYINGERRGTGVWTGPLKTGSYKVECRRENHRSTSTQIAVKPNTEESFLVSAPVPIVGSVYVDTNPEGASVYIDGALRGQSPIMLKDVLIGMHDIKITLDNYKSEEKEIEVKENEMSEIRFTLRDFAQFKISTVPAVANIEMNGEKVGQTPYEFEGASGTYDIRLTAKGYHDFHQSMQLSSSSPNVKIKMAKQYQKATSGYCQLGMQVGSMMAAEATVGAYLKNFNIEASLLFGMAKGVDIYWNYQGLTTQRPLHSIYKPKLSYGLKVGYGIVFGTRYRLTPQAGMLIVNIKDDGGYSKAYATSLNVGARFDVALASFIGVFVAPEYSIPVAKSNVYKTISGTSSTIKRWSNGFNARMGVTFSF